MSRFTKLANSPVPLYAILLRRVACHLQRPLPGSPARRPETVRRIPGKSRKHRLGIVGRHFRFFRRQASSAHRRTGPVGRTGRHRRCVARSRQDVERLAGAALPTKACGCVRSPASSTQTVGAEAPAPVIAVGHRRPRFPEAACPRQGASRRAAIFGSARQSSAGSDQRGSRNHNRIGTVANETAVETTIMPATSSGFLLKRCANR